MYLKTFLIIFIFVFLSLSFMFFRQEKYKKGNYYYNDKNELVGEKIEALVGLNFLYNNSLGVIIRVISSKKIVSKILGWYQDSWLSRLKINSFIKKYDIDVSEFLLSVDKFKSFNDFFIRELKPGTRLIPDLKTAVISPSDSKLFVIPNISLDIEFFVKNNKFSLNTFLQDKSVLVEKYENGQMLIFRLSPSDYHRYHFPFDCFAGNYTVINGILESVNPIVYKSGVQPLYENERQLIELNSNLFGDVLFVSVGAMFVGKIVNTYVPNKNYKKGDEIGYFEFGGSTLVMLFEKDKIKIKQRFLTNSAQGYETEVKMGQIITE